MRFKEEWNRAGIDGHFLGALPHISARGSREFNDEARGPFWEVFTGFPIFRSPLLSGSMTMASHSLDDPGSVELISTTFEQLYRAMAFSSCSPSSAPSSCFRLENSEHPSWPPTSTTPSQMRRLTLLAKPVTPSTSATSLGGDTSSVPKAVH